MNPPEPVDNFGWLKSVTKRGKADLLLSSGEMWRVKPQPKPFVRFCVWISQSLTALGSRSHSACSCQSPEADQDNLLPQCETLNHAIEKYSQLLLLLLHFTAFVIQRLVLHLLKRRTPLAFWEPPCSSRFSLRLLFLCLFLFSPGDISLCYYRLPTSILLSSFQYFCPF